MVLAPDSSDQSDLNVAQPRFFSSPSVKAKVQEFISFVFPAIKNGFGEVTILLPWRTPWWAQLYPPSRVNL